MKSIRFDPLLALMGLGLFLLLAIAFLAPLSVQKVGQVIRQATPAKSKLHATAPAAEPAETASAPALNGVAEQLRNLITGNALDRLVNRKADRAGIEAFYTARHYAPLWVTNNVANERAKSAIAYLALADTVGLDPSDYPVPDFKSASTADALAEAELKLTASALIFARHAQIGRIHFSRVGTDIQYELAAPDPADVLAKLADGSDAGRVLDSFHPPQPGFKALRTKLAELRKGASVDGKAEDRLEPSRVYIPEGQILRPSMKDGRVVVLRKRLSVAGGKDNELYDDAVRDAVKAFQIEADLVVDGNLGPNTVRALNGEHKEVRRPSVDPIDTIIVNMERWRWLPRELGNPHVIVNVPDYTLTLYNDGKPYWHTKPGNRARRRR